MNHKNYTGVSVSKLIETETPFNGSLYEQIISKLFGYQNPWDQKVAKNSKRVILSL
jgi:hypothetical protein